jgi:hypothetical protein
MSQDTGTKQLCSSPSHMCTKKTKPASATNRPYHSVKVNCVKSWPFNVCPFNIQCDKMSTYRTSAEYQRRMSFWKVTLLPPKWDSLFWKHHFYWNKQNDRQTNYGFSVLRDFCLCVLGGTKGLNSGPHACSAGNIPLELLNQPFCIGDFWERVLLYSLTGLGQDAPIYS